jgi:ribosomal-protein-alanine N-acetyltransferase
VIRRATPADAACLAAIDAESNSWPWSAQAFQDSLARGVALLSLGSTSEAEGFVLYSVIADECEILLVGVRPAARRRGVARRLLGEALRQAAVAGATRCFLEVRESNAPAIALYSTAGFRIDARRKGYYRNVDGAEDALLMSCALSG